MFKYFAVVVTAVMLLFLSSSAIHAALPLAPVFNGASLEGWHPVGGADWRVDNGSIVGTVRNGAGGWLVLDTVYGTGQVNVSFECLKNCEPSVMVRSGKSGDKTSGVDIPLSGKDVGTMFRVNLDAQGKVLNRKPMPAFGGEFAMSTVPPNYLTTGGCAPVPCAGIKDAHGGGIGTPGQMAQPVPLALKTDGPNQLVLTLGDSTLAGNYNGARVHGAKNDDGNLYGQIALHVAGPDGAELRVKSIAVRDYTGRKAGLVEPKVSPNYRVNQLNDIFYAEGAAIGDVNHDGKNDVVAGPFFYPGPDFKEAYEIYPPATINIGGAEYPGGPPVPQSGMVVHGNYPPAFMSWIQDLNGDGWNDVVMVMSFGPRPTFSAHAFINPKGELRHWDNEQVIPLITNEASQFVDVDGCGKPELTGQLATRADWSDAEVGYWKPDWADATKPWKWVSVSDKGKWSGHGLATGDVNGDGRLDLVSPAGWWEQPAQGTAAAKWNYHQARFGNGGADIFVYDVNGDAVPDVITSLAAHGPGLSWFEQKKDGTFQEHLIMGAPTVPVDQRATWEVTDKNTAFTELHAVSFADMDGDGLKDIVTGKRWYSHGYRYDDEDDITDPPVLYNFYLKRNAGKVEWVPELVSNQMDAAIQLAIGDVDGDGKADIAASGRKGTAIFFRTVPAASGGMSSSTLMYGAAGVVVLIIALLLYSRRKRPAAA